MNEKLVCSLIKFLEQEKELDQEEIEIYKYGFDALLCDIEQTVLLLIIGAAAHRLLHTVLFLLVLMTVRKYTGVIMQKAN